MGKLAELNLELSIGFAFFTAQEDREEIRA
jgi:hypothetical protein